jgi:hypothetical protein
MRTRDGGYTVLANSLNKAHGLRKAYILDPDGYCWVPYTPLSHTSTSHKIGLHLKSEMSDGLNMKQNVSIIAFFCL